VLSPWSDMHFCLALNSMGIDSGFPSNGLLFYNMYMFSCRGKRDILCGSCNGAGFMGGFMSTFDE
jgi:hypothetical protein